MEPKMPTHPQVDPQTLGDHGGHVVYPMPMFVRLAASDPLRTVDFFTRVLDFDVMFRGPDADGVPVLVHLRRYKYQDILVMPSRRSVQPSAALTVSFAAADADALDALAERIRRHAPDVLDGPRDMPWNARELTVRDPDGHAFVFFAPARTPIAGSVDDLVRAATRRAP